MKNIIDNLKVLTYIRREHLSSEVMNPHSHNSWEILYCTKGTIEIKSYLKDNPSSNIIHVGQYAIIEPNIKHHLAFKEDSYLMVLEIEEIDRLLSNQLLKSEQTKRELPSIYKAYSKLNNVLVLNDTKVMPSRIYGEKIDTKAKIEFLLLKEVEKDLNNAAGFFRSLLSQRLVMRHTPELKFIFDESIEYGQKIERIIKELNIESEEETTEE